MLPGVASIELGLAVLSKLLDSGRDQGCVVIPIVEFAPLDAIASAHPLLPYPRWFWSPRNNATQMFCFGMRKQFNSLEAAKEESTVFPILHTRAFNQQTLKSKNVWGSFELNKIIQPALCIRQDRSNSGCELVADLSFLSTKTHSTADVPVSTAAAQHSPEQDTWNQQLQSCRPFFQEDLSKVVLARQSVTSTEKSPLSLFKSLIMDQPDCYHYYHCQDPQLHFMSCTPEKLCSLNQRDISTEALAGTRPIATTDAGNLQLQQELLSSRKEAFEHGIVIQHIQSVLEQHCTELNIGEQHIVQLQSVQHLCTPIKGKLKAGTNWDGLINGLHPTPAVCGQPKELALKIISEFEAFDRGLYAGLIGVISDQTLECAVSIRSALWRNNQLYIWAGAGIVAESDPTAEWQEICTKSQQFFELVRE